VLTADIKIANRMIGMDTLSMTVGGRQVGFSRQMSEFEQKD
jgi:hypothetical protein